LVADHAGALVDLRPVGGWLQEPAMIEEKDRYGQIHGLADGLARLTQR
jgi:hypothetical protein